MYPLSIRETYPLGWKPHAIAKLHGRPDVEMVQQGYLGSMGEKRRGSAEQASTLENPSYAIYHQWQGRLLRLAAQGATAASLLPGYVITSWALDGSMIGTATRAAMTVYCGFIEGACSANNVSTAYSIPKVILCKTAPRGHWLVNRQ